MAFNTTHTAQSAVQRPEPGWSSAETDESSRSGATHDANSTEGVSDLLCSG